MTIHPVVTATSSAASTAMNTSSITGLLLHVASPVAASVLPIPMVVDISLVCVDCRQFVGVILKYSVMVVVVVGYDGAGGATGPWEQLHILIRLHSLLQTCVQTGLVDVVGHSVV